jgi:hypothetical protein
VTGFADDAPARFWAAARNHLANLSADRDGEILDSLDVDVLAAMQAGVNAIVAEWGGRMILDDVGVPPDRLARTGGEPPWHIADRDSPVTLCGLPAQPPLAPRMCVRCERVHVKARFTPTGGAPQRRLQP